MVYVNQEQHNIIQKIKTGNIGDGGCDTSCTYLLHRETYGGNSPCYISIARTLSQQSWGKWTFSPLAFDRVAVETAPEYGGKKYGPF